MFHFCELLKPERKKDRGLLGNTGTLCKYNLLKVFQLNTVTGQKKHLYIWIWRCPEINITERKIMSNYKNNRPSV